MECDYCSEEFESEDEYLRHLRDNHEGELSTVDERKVEKLSPKSTEDGGSNTFTYVMVTFSTLVVLAILVFSVVGNPFTDSSTQPVVAPGGGHYHGPITVEILGDRVDFSKPKYQLQADSFHFEAGNGERWHVHARSITLKWAMSTVGINITDNAVEFNGTTYKRSEYNITVEVNGESVEPTYRLKRGDNITIRVEEN